MTQDKLGEFVTLLNTFREYQARHGLIAQSVKNLIQTVHDWGMDNLDRKNPEIAGTNRRPRSHVAPTGHAREPFAFKRYETFVHGAMVFDNYLLEFLPGTVYVHELPGSHLVSFKFPNEHLDLPESIHVHYGHNTPTYVFRKYMRQGWMHMEGSGNTWHTAPAGSWIGMSDYLAAINGGAIRMIYSYFNRTVRDSQFSKLEKVDLWKGAKQEWGADLLTVCKNKTMERDLRGLRDGMTSFDPTLPALVELYGAIVTLSDPILSTEQIYRLGHEMICDTLTNISK